VVENTLSRRVGGVGFGREGARELLERASVPSLR
jgi:hypothetical protein